MTVKCCDKCGTELTDGARFCHRCGASTAKTPTVDTATKTPSKNKRGGSFAKAIVKKFIVLLVSILLVVFAFLLMLSISVTDRSTDLDIELNFSTVDTVVFFFDSLRSLDSDEIAEHDYIDIISEIGDEIGSIAGNAQSLDELDHNERKVISELSSDVAYYTLRMSLQSEDTPLTPSRAATAFLSVAYILLTVALRALAATDLAMCLAGSDKTIQTATASLLSIAPVLSIVLYAVFRCSYFLAIGNSLSTPFVVWAVIAAVVAIAYVIVDRMFISSKPQINIGRLIRRCCSLAIAVLMFATVFMPTVSLEAKAVFKNKTSREALSSPIYVSFFQSFSVTEDEIYDYGETHTSDIKENILTQFGSLSKYSKKQFLNGECTELCYNIMFESFMGFGAEQLAPAMALLPLLMIIVSLVAAVVIWQNLFAASTGKGPSGYITVPVRIIGIIAAVAAVVLVIIFLVCTNYGFGRVEFERSCHTVAYMGCATVIATVASVALLAIPMKNGKKARARVDEICDIQSI